jgi:hypothetical protein
MIAAVILNHNKPENADRLFEKLTTAFEQVELIDSGSDGKLVPIHTTAALDNIYWTGGWDLIMERWADRDAVWMLGCDVTLLEEPQAYRDAIESALPFGVWSPAITGRAHPFMQASECQRRPYTVKNIEGVSMAVSGPLMGLVGRLPDGSPIGFGHDFWMCHKAREAGMSNILDGRVHLHHPPGIGYNEEKAHSQMEKTYTALYGADFRKTVFNYSASFEGNLLAASKPDKERKTMKIVTVDNGWGVPEFCRIVRHFPDDQKVVMRKGISHLHVEEGVEVINYDDTLRPILDADVALFARVGAANKEEYGRLQDLGIPCVVNVAFQMGRITHEETGFVYGNETWAIEWVKHLQNKDLRDKISANCRKEQEAAPAEAPAEAPAATPESPTEPGTESAAPVESAGPGPVVSVITPTYRRAPEVIARCIDCLKLQTLGDWEQIVCSDGMEELAAKAVVEGMKDPRVTYTHTTERKDGDFGNTVRSEMLKRVKGKYVLFFDDDNVIMPHYLETMVKAIEEAGKTFAVCRIMHFGPLNEPVLGKPPIVLEGEPVKLYHVDPLQVLVERNAMKEVGWDTEHGYVADGYTLEQLGNRFEHVHVPEVLGVHL